MHSQGLRACWSYPIIASDDRVLGTFGFYSAHPGYPTKAQTDLFEAVVYLARLALEQEQGDHDRRLMEQQLLQSQKFESLGVLTGGIAHDFNNLLTAILGATGIVLTELSPHSQLRVWMSQIQNAALQASDLARQMLIYSGQSQPEHQPLDLNVMIESMRHLLQLSVHKKSQIEWELGENLPLLSADPTQLRQILMNLVINASDALNQGPGTIQIRTSLVTAIDTNLSYAICQPDVWETEYLCLMVRDTGCGMTPETRVRIFDPFFTTKFTGRGLGLAAVLGVIRMHHGAILLESEVDHGTTFRLLFPASKLPPPVRTEEQVVTPVVKPPQTMRILVVDDEVLVREVISATLQRNGAHTEGVCDGESAISRLTDGPEDFDLVLLDWKMPGCDGIETMQLLRQINPQLPIILMTGSTDQEVSQRLGTQQPSALLKKPFLPRQLQKTVQQVLQPYTSS